MTGPVGTPRLADELVAARADLFDALGAVDPGSLTTPGLVGEWSARELIAHLGYWVGHAVEVIHAAEEGRIDEIDHDAPPTDEMNAIVARIARDTDLVTVRKREAASVEALLERLRRLDPALLSMLLPDGASLEAGIEEDASAHYREHAEDLRQTLAERTGDG
ncbi:MAG TPA: maleylpyruvate isomerase N-terminal domain-containing protein [Candidatus Limnocylindria bacterium]